MKTQLKILHLSDIHYSKASREATRHIIKALLQDLHERLDHSGDGYDLAVFSGDLANSGLEEEFLWAFDDFLHPLLEATNLTANQLCIVPGNHDVNRKKINECEQEGFKKMYANKRLDEFMAREREDGWSSTLFQGGLEPYNSFRQILTDSSSPVRTNNLYSTHFLTKRNIHVKIAALNSAWLSRGGHTDNRYLLVGEHQIQSALDDFETTKTLGEIEVKIAVVHHPLNWLYAFDEGPCAALLARNVHLLMTGHTHELSPASVCNIHGKLVTSGAGALFRGEKTAFHGYTSIVYEPEAGRFEFQLREYSSERSKFIAAERLVEGGRLELSAREDTSKKQSNPQQRPAFIGEEQDISESLLSSVLSPTPPRLLTEIFVQQPLSENSPAKSLSQTDFGFTTKNTKEILDSAMAEQVPEKAINAISLLTDSTNSYIFFGKQGAGKTCLLQFLYLKALQLFRPKFKIRFINAGSPLELENLEDRTLSIFFLDNFNQNDDAKVKLLQGVIQTTPTCRYFIAATITDDITLELDAPRIADTLQLKCLYIRPYSASQFRRLAQIWFSQAPNRNEMLEAARLNCIPFTRNLTPLLSVVILCFTETFGTFLSGDRLRFAQHFFEQLILRSEKSLLRKFRLEIRNLERLLGDISIRSFPSPTIDYDIIESACAHFCRQREQLLPASEFAAPLVRAHVLQQADGNYHFTSSFLHGYILARFIERNRQKFPLVVDDRGYSYAKDAIELVALANPELGAHALLAVSDSLEHLCGKFSQDAASEDLFADVVPAHAAEDPENDHTTLKQNTNDEKIFEIESPEVELKMLLEGTENDGSITAIRTIFAELEFLARLIRATVDEVDHNLTRATLARCIDCPIKFASKIRDVWNQTPSRLRLEIEYPKDLPSPEDDSTSETSGADISHIILPILIQLTLSPILGIPSMQRHLQHYIMNCTSPGGDIIGKCLLADASPANNIQSLISVVATDRRKAARDFCASKLSQIFMMSTDEVLNPSIQNKIKEALFVHFCEARKFSTAERVVLKSKFFSEMSQARNRWLFREQA